MYNVKYVSKYKLIKKFTVSEYNFMTFSPKSYYELDG